jgi:hypothetical protein
MWAKGSILLGVANSRGTSKNYIFCRDQLMRGLNMSERKLKALYSFVITCLPHIEVTTDLETAKFTGVDQYLKLIANHTDLHIVVWFCVQLKYDFARALREWAKSTADSVNVQVTADHFRPDSSLKKVTDMIARNVAWKAAGLSKELLAQVAQDIKKYLAFKLAKGFDSKLVVSIRSYTLLTV